MNDQRFPASEVRSSVSELVGILAAHAERVEIGGSLRRGAETVKDVELVILNPKSEFYTRLDTMVSKCTISKAIYQAGTFRWGQKYRGLIYRGVRFELFVTDGDNFGYIWWLRTGPGDANQFAVTALKYSHPPFTVHDGYVWSRRRERLRIGDERDWFALLGLPYLAPEQRTLSAYAPLRRSAHRWGEVTAYVTSETEQHETLRQERLL